MKDNVHPDNSFILFDQSFLFYDHAHIEIKNDDFKTRPLQFLQACFLHIPISYTFLFYMD